MKDVRVKICGITRDVDLHAALEAGADALGFVFARHSKRVLAPKAAEMLVRQVPAFISRVGLFLDQDSEQVAGVLNSVPLSLLQFHGTEEAEYCRQFGLPYIKAVSIDSPQAVRQAEKKYPDAAALLLDSHQPGGVGGTGNTFNWSLIGKPTMPVVLAGGLTPDNVRQAVKQLNPWAVDVSSGVEDSPGVKNAEKMQKFIREAKSEY